MANKKVSQLSSKPSVLVTDLFPIADPTTGQLFKTTISALGTAIGSGVSSVNTLVGAVVLDTDDIQELASPTNRWYTDTRSRAALSAGVGISYNSGTGVITNAVTSGLIATALGYTPADDALVVKLAGSQTITGTKTFQQAPLLDLGAGFKNSNGVYNYLQSLVTGWQIPVNGNNHNLIFSTTTNYVYTFPNATGTIALTSDLHNAVTIGTANGLSLSTQVLSLGLSSSSANGALSSTDWTTFNNKIGGSGLTEYYARFTSSGVITDGFISTSSNITTVAGMGLTTQNGLNILGNYGAGGGGQKIRSFDETTGIAYIDFANTGGRFYLGVNKSTSGGLMTNATAYATVLTTGLGTTNLEFGTNATKRLTIDGTTGAVTFTSTISATGATLTGALSGTSATFVGGTGGLNFTTSTTITNTGSGAFTAIYANGGGIYLGGSASTNHLSIVSTGAATFTNTVKAKSFLPAYAASTLANESSGIVWTNGTIADTFGFVVQDGVYFQGDFNNTNNTFGIRTATSNGSIGSPLFVVKGSGNVGIGTTTPVFPLQVTKTGTDSGIYGYNVAQFGDATTNAQGLRIATSTATSGLTNLIAATNNDASQFAFWTWTGAAWGERMRITSSGNVGIGTTAPSWKLSVANEAVIGAQGGSDYTYISGGSGYGAKVRLYYANGSINSEITGNGNTILNAITGSVIIGTTTGNGKLNITQDQGSNNQYLNFVGTQSSYSQEWGFGIVNSSRDFRLYDYTTGVERIRFDTGGNMIHKSYSVGQGILMNYSGNGTTYGFFNAGNGTLYITNSGVTNAAQINMTSGAYTALSDRNKKKDFEPSTLGLAEILQLIPTMYRFKTEADDTPKHLGFIAQDVKDIVPPAYKEQMLGDETFIGLENTAIIPVLVKAIQELKAELDTLKNK
jgi:hypothetical protein